jgi:putative transposase
MLSDSIEDINVQDISFRPAIPPLSAKKTPTSHIVKTMEELDVYPWAGHSVIMGKKRLFWQDTGYVLQWFGHSKKSYRTFIQKGVEAPVPNLEGGGLVRSSEGQISQRQRKNPVLGDQRILGTRDFVNNLLARKLKQKSLSLTERQQKMDEILQGHCEKAGIALKQLQGGSRAMPLPRIRSEIAHLLVEAWEFTMPK